MIPAFPKLLTIGNRLVNKLFEGEVEVTEKIDGSQFSFGKDMNGELQYRSKGAQLFWPDNCQDLFKPVVEWVNTISHKIPKGTVFHGETLKSKKHNALTYSRVPEGHFILFGVRSLVDQTVRGGEALYNWAEILGCEAVPILYHGQIRDIDQLHKLMDKESVLGGVNMEGVVVKRYENFLIGGELLPLMGAKLVSEQFKEVHSKEAYGKKVSKNAIDSLFDNYKTEARWRKAIQHLRENGQITDTPADIGILLKEIQIDTEQECAQEIKEALWQILRKDFLRNLTKGFPEWYKNDLLTRNIQEGNSSCLEKSA